MDAEKAPRDVRRAKRSQRANQITAGAAAVLVALEVVQPHHVEAFLALLRQFGS